MNTEFICLAVVVTCVVTAWATIRFCSDAVLHGGRNWWKRSLYLAEQRLSYKCFCNDLDELEKLGRMASDAHEDA